MRFAVVVSLVFLVLVSIACSTVDTSAIEPQSPATSASPQSSLSNNVTPIPSPAREADIAPLMVELTAFQARLRTDRAINLTVEPFVELRDAISSPTHYEETQQLGADMRDAGVVLFRYSSARDAEGGACIGLFSPLAFARKQPFNFKLWHCVVDRRGVELSRKDFIEKASYSFPREQFLIGGQLPSPAT